MQAYNRTTYLADWLLCLLLQRVMCVIACGKSLKLDCPVTSVCNKP